MAVVPVMLFHAGISSFSGGYLGVDVFFVISGYLITGILISELEAGRFSLVGFYERRARRILPALFLVAALSIPLAWMWMLPEDLVGFAKSLAAVSVFSSNILFWRESSYFDTAAELKPLLHTWSLGVEEQYYLLFPLAMLLAWRLGRKKLAGLLAIAALCSFAAAQRGALYSPVATFFLLPTRGWELLLGALVAFHMSGRQLQVPAAPAGEAASAAGLAMLVLSLVLPDRIAPSFPGLGALLATTGTALIILHATPGTLVGRLLGTRLLVGVGLISYSAYLWHQPLMAFARHRLGDVGPATMLALVAASLVLAYFSWSFVEKPFRDRHRTSRRFVAAFAVAGSTIFICMGVAGVVYDGFPSRFGFFDDRSESNLLARRDNGWCFYSFDATAQVPVGDQGVECRLGSKSPVLRGLLFGDSFAGQYEPFWDRVGAASGASINAVTTNWCYPDIALGFTGPPASPAFEQCRINRRHLIDKSAEYDFVVLSGYWRQVSQQGKLDGTKALIGELAAKAKLVVLMPSPTIFDSNVNVSYQKSSYFGQPFDIGKAARTRDEAARQADADLKAFAGQFSNVVYIDRSSIFRANGRPSDLTQDGKPFSWDGYHISIYGSRKAADAFMETPAFLELRAALQRLRN